MQRPDTGPADRLGHEKRIGTKTFVAHKAANRKMKETTIQATAAGVERVVMVIS